MHTPSAMQDEMHNINDRLHSMEANIFEILSYLRPGSSRRGRGRGCHYASMFCFNRMTKGMPQLETTGPALAEISVGTQISAERLAVLLAYV
ncbi:hypothetical protein V6N11_047928 [Hibiscus sabdariffa]|uniref:Uncharacterized protein n=1 Tax=Hibiscus sabdariffa TaxID=183260 RepID=A0ABR2NX86_9ROSI